MVSLKKSWLAEFDSGQTSIALSPQVVRLIQDCYRDELGGAYTPAASKKVPAIRFMRTEYKLGL